MEANQHLRCKIRPAARHEWRPALECVLQGQPTATRDEQIAVWIAEAEQSPETLLGLLIATAGGEIHGAALARCLPGRSATIWPAQFDDAVDPAIAAQLIERVLAWLATTDARTVQALLPLGQSPEARQLGAAGFDHLADMQFLVWFVPPASADEVVASAGLKPQGLGAEANELKFVEYEPRWRARLEAVIERTYAGSQDCPRLGDARAIGDALDGYASHGESQTRGWYLVERDGQDVGCLLMAVEPASGFSELVYMGIVPEARGAGLGRQLIEEAQRRACQLGQARLALAVDAANRPAIALYDAANFITWETRSIYFRRIVRTS